MARTEDDQTRTINPSINNAKSINTNYKKDHSFLMKLPGEPQSIYLGWLVVLSIEILQKEHVTSFQPQGNLERHQKNFPGYQKRKYQWNFQP